MKKIILVLAVLIVLSIGSYLIFKNQTWRWGNVEKSSSYKYSNDLLGYEINIKGHWRVATDLSKYYSTLYKATFLAVDLGCFDISLEGKGVLEQELNKDKFNKCLKDNPSYAKEVSDFEKNWKLKTSDIILLTSMDTSEEIKLRDDIKAGQKSFVSSLGGNVIQVYPSEVGSLSKETSPESKSKIRIKFTSIPDGTKVYQIDVRALPAGKLSILVPHNFTFKLGDGKIAKSLEFQTTALIGTADEKDFYDLVNSLHFIKAN